MDAPAILQIDQVSKQFEQQNVLKAIQLQLQPHQQLALLGPSGSGKSTLLRCIAGFEEIDNGEIRISGNTVASTSTHIPPELRRIGVVFQEVALFPHLSVNQNISFGLRDSASEKKKRVDELLEWLGLTHLSGKMPHQISGGEQQRIAIARALAPRPQLLLMDEPFSSLDTNLRTRLRTEIKEQLKQAGITTVLVTHDQAEAFEIADQVAVMHQGHIQQLDSPQNIYFQPANTWVANFVGNANFLKATVKEQHAHTELGIFPLEENHHYSDTYQLMIRPEELSVSCSEAEIPHGNIQSVQFYGSYQELEILLHSGQIIKAQIPARTSWEAGQPVSLQCQYYHLLRS